MTCCDPAPGTDTLTWSLPCCCTWAPVVPVPFTRDRRIDTAWLISADGGGWPLGVCAWSTTWVPLDRSSPSPTLNCCCHLPGWKVSTPTIEISIITMTMASVASRRHGREPILPGDVIDRLPSRSLC